MMEILELFGRLQIVDSSVQTIVLLKSLERLLRLLNDENVSSYTTIR